MFFNVCVNIFLFCFQAINTFNIDTLSPYLYTVGENKLNNVTYFGYSLLLHPETQSFDAGVFIGAPLDTSFSSPSRNGAVYYCRINNNCTKLNIKNGNSDPASKGWLGAVMAIDPNFDRVVFCAPRKLNQRYYLLPGGCYWTHLSQVVKKTDANFKEMSPLNDVRRKRTDLVDSTYYFYAYGQFGFSVHLISASQSSGLQHELISGSPGLLNWLGGAVIYKDAQTMANSSFISTEFEKFSIADFKKSYYKDHFSLFGYSISSGRFYNSNKRFYVSGIPKAATLTGQIKIFTFDNDYFDVNETKQGAQVGEYFGYSLAVGDVNNDGFDDLIVGAPFYKSSKFNEGRAQIYLGGQYRLQDPIDNILYGKSAKGQFGATVQFLQDLNKDGFGDVAIAAPYENDDSGVVYIFSGTNLGLNSKPCQIILGKDIYANIRGFGVSISNAADIDSNGYVDLAIGAHFSEHAAILRTSPTVQVFHSISTNVTFLKIDEKFVAIEVCVWFETFSVAESTPITIKKHLIIDEEFERVKSANYQDVAILTKKMVKNCEKVNIMLKENLFNEYYNPIKIVFWHEFQHISRQTGIKWIPDRNNSNNDDHFCPRCLVYDKERSSRPAKLEIPFSLGCGNDNICDSFLEFFQTVLNTQNNVFIMGSSNTITLSTFVKNSKETAYKTKLIIRKPELLSINQTPKNCEVLNSTAIECVLGVQIVANKSERLDLNFDVSLIDNEHVNNTLEFFTAIETRSVNTNQNDTNYVQIRLKQEADITIKGQSGEKSYSFGEIADGKPNFTQLFQVEKLGKSPIDLVQVEIDIPQFLCVRNKQIQFMYIHPIVSSFAGEPIDCKSNISYWEDGAKDFLRTKREIAQQKSVEKNQTYLLDCLNNTNVQCSKIVCTIGPFSSSKNIGLLQIQMQADVNAILTFLDVKFDHLFISTNGLVSVIKPENFMESGLEPNFVKVTTNFVGDKSENIQLRIIIIAVIVGLLMLALLILPLIKLGFFKREQKEKLEKLKEEEKAQEEYRNSVGGENVADFVVEEEGTLNDDDGIENEVFAE